MTKNNLTINLDKTKAIHFRTYKSNRLDINITHNNNSLNIIESTVFLGITLDEHCSWKKHIDTLCKKVNKFVFALRRIRKVSSFQVALQAYYGYVASLLRYCIIIWGNSVDFDRVFRAQKSCIRALCNIRRRDSCKPLFQQHKILNLPCLYIAEMCLFVKKYPEYFAKNKQVKSNVRDSRKNKLAVPKCNLTLFMKNAYYMAITLFNKLPPGLRDLPMANNRFKNSLLCWLYDKNFYSIKEYLDFKES